MNIIHKYITKIKNHYRTKVEPVLAIIDICGACNARCLFCARQNSKNARVMPPFMDYATFDSILAKLQQLPSIKTICLAAYGEPLLHPSFAQIVRRLRELKYRVAFPTNMSLAHKNMDTLLHVQNIMLSIEGHDKKSYEQLRVRLNYETTLKNVVALDEQVRQKRAQGKPTPLRTLNYIIRKSSDINRFLDLWGPYVDEIRIGPIMPAMDWDQSSSGFIQVFPSQLRNEFYPMRRILRKKRCLYPFNIIYIKPNAQLGLCCSEYNAELDFGRADELPGVFFF